MEPETTCNAILDFSVHANNMSKEQALHLLVAGFQQQAEADGKWNRVTLSSSFVHTLQATLKFMILEKDLKRRKMANLT
jgi:hypothetical protein